MPKPLKQILFGTLGMRLLSKRPSDPLDDVLMTWPTGDQFTVRHMLRSVEAKGITGSGKSSGSGATVLNAVVRHPRSTCLIVAQKPEEKEVFQEMFARHRKKLVVIEEGGPWRCNFLDTEVKAGADTRDLVEFISTLGEALEGSAAGRENERFWKMLEQRIIFNAMVALRLGATPDAPGLLRFISTAAYKPDQLKDPAWRERDHNQIMKAAWEKKDKSIIQKADFELIRDFWQNEFVLMDDKPRSSGLAGVMNTLHTFNTGLVRMMCSTETSVPPAVLDEGTSILVNFPFSSYGPTGRFIAGGWKYLVQKHILRRKWDPSGFFNVMMLDEYQESATEMDARYLAQCRSHGGAMFTLTQTVNSEYAAIGGKGQHRADQLLSNFGTHIYHVSDPTTAKFASALLGQRRETFISSSPSASQGIGEDIFGHQQNGGSISESYQPILQPSAFMTDLRAGGPPHFCVDGIVIRVGERFRNGENWIKVAFRQK